MNSIVSWVQFKDEQMKMKTIEWDRERDVFEMNMIDVLF